MVYRIAVALVQHCSKCPCNSGVKFGNQSNVEYADEDSRGPELSYSPTVYCICDRGRTSQQYPKRSILLMKGFWPTIPIVEDAGKPMSFLGDPSMRVDAVKQALPYQWVFLFRICRSYACI